MACLERLRHLMMVFIMILTATHGAFVANQRISVVFPRPLVFPPPCRHQASVQIRSSNEDSFGADNDEEDDVTLNMDKLKQRIQQQQNQYFQLLVNEDEDREMPETVHIIMFNPGTEEQGVHTIEFPQGSGWNVLLAFESSEDCELFCRLLVQENTMGGSNIPARAESLWTELKEYCDSVGLPVKVVPTGRDLRPPSDRVDELSIDVADSDAVAQLEDCLEQSESLQSDAEPFADFPDDGDDGSMGSWQ